MPVITQSLCQLLNLSLRLGQIPVDWKSATVIPIFKNNRQPAGPTSYRPIYLPPAIAKLLDSIVAEHLTRCLSRHDIISAHQYGFVRRRSTLDQLVMLTSRIAKAMDKRSTYHTLFLDFAKAFDKVPHPVLLYHLGMFATQNASWWPAIHGQSHFLRIHNPPYSRWHTTRIPSRPYPVPSVHQLSPADHPRWGSLSSFFSLPMREHNWLK